ncbi:MinD-like ATPase involved in chromosome partitioning or flagellar assembly [Nitrospirillum amazonense]|uniref:MinD-like ATPase involved in chromosome partitioning or flagellar assembly n=1 Tax=Nitrospirillum amazonense TaxID=28077 RepID=A0A560JAF5_9PROT|nr:AAA family ATPase [Nitrospirillum amazonense]TWB67977.1 MinD-like ATPase involved in chromosome partitioning or flagellar assembly [Nitrospirillum amazonense]
MSDVKHFRDYLNNNFPGAHYLDVGTGNFAILTIIDDRFSGLDRPSRLAKVQPELEAAGLKPGIVDLYTTTEAAARSVTLPNEPIVAPADWEQAVAMIEAGKTFENITLKARKFRRIVFYSYKGGVGRSTSLVHTAFHLARSGQRVVVIDMDVEAPGLHVLLPPPEGSTIKVGLVDYLWERQIRPLNEDAREDFETCLSGSSEYQGTPISYAIEDKEFRTQIHVIPAGAVGANYVKRLHVLSYQDVLAKPHDAWALFEEELANELDPDVVLIDARTGLGDWGGLSLLRLADEAFFVMYPSEQNIDGIKFAKEVTEQTVGISIHILVSPVPEGIIGKNLLSRILPKLELDDDEIIPILYNPNLAAADQYPVESAMAGYARIANLIRDTQAQDRVEESLQQADALKIIESLNFPDRDAKSIAAKDFDQFFQKTLDFERFLDDARWVVRGRKGTGKSTLFHLFAEHQENAAKRARGRLDGIDILPGHGPVNSAQFGPKTDVFGDIAKELLKDGGDWLSLWRAYAIVRIYTRRAATIDTILAKSEMRILRDFLRSHFPREDNAQWRTAQTSALLGLVGREKIGLCRDLMRDVNKGLEQQGRKLWLLYDDLDQDILENATWQGDALGGLLRLAYDSNNQGMHNIRFKIFLREDIWNGLVFTNKSHFGPDRTLLLEWRISDFLRLAYRMVSGGSSLYRTLAHRELPLTENEIDSAPDEDLYKVLAPLWGLRKERSKNQSTARWVYSRMTDAANNTYPRSLAILLKKARETELETRLQKMGTKAVSTGSDRLLGPPAMLAGLKEASDERVNALKNESPRLKPFLDAVISGQLLRSQFERAELEQVWQKTSQESHSDFGRFVDELKQAGLLVEKKSNSQYDYGIASLYIDGLGVQRVQGEKK